MTSRARGKGLRWPVRHPERPRGRRYGGTGRTRLRRRDTPYRRTAVAPSHRPGVPPPIRPTTLPHPTTARLIVASPPQICGSRTTFQLSPTPPACPSHFLLLRPVAPIFTARALQNSPSREFRELGPTQCRNAVNSYQLYLGS
jgi:hypothetical protein